MAAKPPEILVPVDTDMATEPARTIGQRFADQAFVRNAVGAVITITGIAAPHFASTIDDNEANAISLVVLIVASSVATWKARATPLQQAKETRENVYAPATVAAEVAKAQAGAGQPVDAVVIESPPKVTRLPGQ